MSRQLVRVTILIGGYYFFANPKWDFALQQQYRGWVQTLPESRQKAAYENFYLPQWEEVNSVLDSVSEKHLRIFETTQGFYPTYEQSFTKPIVSTKRAHGG